METLRFLSAALLFVSCFFVFSSVVAADNRITKTVSERLTNYELELAYTLLGKNEVPNWNTINQKLVGKLRSDGCDPLEAGKSNIGYYYDASAEIEAVTPGYVTFRIHYSVFCGGAHPSHGLDFLVYDVVTGEPLDVAGAIPFQDYDSSAYDTQQHEQFQGELADLIIQYLPAESDARQTCPEVFENRGELISVFSPRIVALGQNEDAIILAYPPHVISVCQFYVAVPFSKVQHYFTADSIIHHRMD